MSDREILEHGRYHELSFRGIDNWSLMLVANAEVPAVI